MSTMFFSPRINVGERAAGGALAIYADHTMQSLMPLWAFADLQPDSEGRGKLANPVPIDNNGINSSPVFFEDSDSAYYVVRDARGAIIRQGFVHPYSWQSGGSPPEPQRPPWEEAINGKADNAGSIDAGSGSDTDTPAQESATVWGMLQKIWNRIYALAAGKFNNPAGDATQYIRGDGELAEFPDMASAPPTSIGTGGVGAVHTLEFDKNIYIYDGMNRPWPNTNNLFMDITDVIFSAEDVGKCYTFFVGESDNMFRNSQMIIEYRSFREYIMHVTVGCSYSLTLMLARLLPDGRGLFIQQGWSNN